jgi:cardiolipin synthase
VTGWLNLPNLLTLLRLLLAAPVVYAIATGQAAVALVLFIAAGFTDLLDGAAARRFGTVTAWGAYFDPIADKVLLSSVFIAMTWAGILPAWYLWLVLGRDVMIVAGVVTIMAFTKERKFPPSRLGKFSTFFQLGCAVMWMVRNAWPVAALHVLADVSLWLSTAFTAASGLDYIRRGARIGRH